MPSHSKGPGIWLSVWRFLLTHCLYERAVKVARMSRLAWTFAARIGDKYQIRLTRSIFSKALVGRRLRSPEDQELHPYTMFNLVSKLTFNAVLSKAITLNWPSYHNNFQGFLYTDWQKKRYNRNQSCFIQAVISSNHVEINQQKSLVVSCCEGISNFLQRYHLTGVYQGRNLTSRMPSLSSNFQKTWIHWTIKKERDNHRQ